MRRWLALVIAAGACACPSKPEPVTGGSAGGPGSGIGSAGTGPAGAAAGCDAARAHVEELYRAEIKQADLVADDTAMVMKDCAKEPARVATCAANAKTVAELEKTCLIPLDPEGTEGDALKKP